MSSSGGRSPSGSDAQASTVETTPRTSLDPTLAGGDSAKDDAERASPPGSRGSMKLRPKAAAAAQSQVSTEDAQGTISSWSQNPGAAEDEQKPPEDMAFWQAGREDDVASLRRMVEEDGHSIDKKDEHGCTILHIAAQSGSMHVVQYLVENRHANINVLGDAFNASPLFYAISNQQLGVVVYLVEHGADATLLDTVGNCVLHASVHSGSLPILAYLLSTQLTALGGSVNVRDNYGMTPLIWASYQCKLDMLQLLIRLGADVNARDKTGKTALHFAVINGLPAVRVTLLAKGADPDLKDIPADPEASGQSPRDLAISIGFTKMMDGHIKEAAGIRFQEEPGYTVFGRSLRKEIAASVLPLVGIGLALSTISIYPWRMGVPLGLLLLAAMHFIFIRYITQYRQRLLLQRLPYVSAVFQSSAFYILFTWVTRVLPVTTRGQHDGLPIATHKLLNVLFMWTFGSCMYYFYSALAANPGIMPRNNTAQAAAPVIRKLAVVDRLDADNFCFICMNERPLRSKHCRSCNHCVVRFDHHCPWMCNCVGWKNHRTFMLFVILLSIGIPMYLLLVKHYLDKVFIGYDPIDTRPCYLGNYLCGSFQTDSWTIVSAVWITFNLIWVMFLMVSQLVQIAIGKTTYEFSRGFLRLSERKNKGCKHGRSHGHGKGLLRKTASRFRSLIVGLGGTVAVEDQTPAPDPQPTPEGEPRPPPISHSNTSEEEDLLPQNTGMGGSFAMRSMGYSQLRDIDRKKAKTDPFNFGTVDNCLDFWTNSAKGKLAGTNWMTVMDITELAPYRPPQPPSDDHALEDGRAQYNVVV